MIESPSNPTVRMLRDLHSRDGRREHGAFLIEGVRLVAEAVATNHPLVAALFDPERARADPVLAGVVARIPAAAPASARALRHAADTVTPQGIVAAARGPTPVDRVEPSEPLVLVMDGIADPANAGTLLRSAVGAGIRTVLTSPGSVDPFSPKVVRGGMGAHFRLALGADLPWEAIERLLGENRSLVVAEARAETRYYLFDWRRPAALLVGSEAHGPGQEARRRATAGVSIPLAGGLESLNAAVAASVVMFEAKRQREMGGPIA